MSVYHFAWLGSKRAQKNGVNEKGWRLDRAARVGLPVPQGGILLDNLYRLARQEELVIWQGDGLAESEPGVLHDLIYTAVRFPRLEAPCILRALPHEPHLHIPPCRNLSPAEPARLTNAILELWTALGSDDTDQRELLLQEMISFASRGRALTAPGRAKDEITSGANTLFLPRLARWGRNAAKTPPYAPRLQRLLSGLRRTFGDESWQIEWADDGRICWLMQMHTHPE